MQVATEDELASHLLDRQIPKVRVVLQRLFEGLQYVVKVGFVSQRSVAGAHLSSFTCFGVLLIGVYYAQRGLSDALLKWPIFFEGLRSALHDVSQKPQARRFQFIASSCVRWLVRKLCP